MATELFPEVYDLMTEELTAGLVTFQEKLMLQLLAPEAMTQEEEAGVRVPDI